MDPASWVSLGSSVLGTFKGNTKISGSGASGAAGLSQLDNGGWDTGAGAVGFGLNNQYILLAGALLVGVILLKKGK